MLPPSSDQVPSELMLLRQSYQSFDHDFRTSYPPPSDLVQIPTIRDIQSSQDGSEQTIPVQLAKDKYEKQTIGNLLEKRTWWGALALLTVLVVLMTVYHKNIVHWLQPVSARIRSLSWGWLIPILVLIALSFPPLFGHEIVIILCGAVYSLWIGFGIVAAGTFIGEILTYFAFRTTLDRKAKSAERKNLDYAALARITCEGGFWIVFIVRLSVVQGHFSTAVFAVCRVNFWAFAFASLVTLPKQLIIVYLGVILGNGNGGKLISNIVLGVTFLVTVLAGVYILWRLRITRRAMVLEAGRISGRTNTKLREQGLETAAHDNKHGVQTGPGTTCTEASCRA
ncbi:Tlg2-vesicle protein [Orbilia oligospora]|uniref:Golgi apparatus membrane protein TVP38 n=1 Tax=Orbilia oligospora TaxID=2813651 RepID=A0A7C8NMX8_ORBOL|nr:Tlg2-vesicle protein [Orbilia oligospora]KAF3145439.1 Tlg2-vesicle protein [Orbilia oligospora]